MSERRTHTMVAGRPRSGTDCENCGTSYAKCTRKILEDHAGPCCGACGNYDTHDVHNEDHGPEPTGTNAVIERLRSDLAGSTPDYPVGTVIRFKVRYSSGGTEYVYAALYVGGFQWYTTSRFDSAEHFQPVMGTRALMRSLVATKAYNLAVASEWERVPR